MNNTKNKPNYRVVVINNTHSSMLKRCASHFGISKCRMVQVALFHIYNIDSVRKGKRYRYEEKETRYVSIEMNENQLKELDIYQKEVLNISFSDIVRRSIEAIYNKIFDDGENGAGEILEAINRFNSGEELKYSWKTLSKNYLKPYGRTNKKKTFKMN